MTRRLLWIFVATLAGLTVAQISSGADTTRTALPVLYYDISSLSNLSLAKSAVLESNVAYLQVVRVGTNLADEIRTAQGALAVSNKTAGTVLDLRFAGGDDVEAAKAAANLFATKKLPLAILVNSQTRGAAAALAADLRDKRAGLVFGSAVETDGSTDGKISPVQPDITVPVTLADDRSFVNNPFGPPPPNGTQSVATEKNDFLPFVDHTTEADLVRARIKDGDQGGNIATPARPAEPPKLVIRDPVLARAVDLIKGLAIVRAPHS